MARPTKLTPKKQREIVTAIVAGNYIETAAAYAGISKNTFYDWLERGRRERDSVDAGHEADPDEAKFARFSDAIEKALADSESGDLATIGIAAASGQWTAAAWRLERKFPQRWGRRFGVTGGDGGPVKIETTSDLARQFEQLVERTAARMEQEEPDGEGEVEGQPPETEADSGPGVPRPSRPFVR